MLLVRPMLSPVVPGVIVSRRPPRISLSRIARLEKKTVPLLKSQRLLEVSARNDASVNRNQAVGAGVAAVTLRRLNVVVGGVPQWAGCSWTTLYLQTRLRLCGVPSLMNFPDFPMAVPLVP